MAKAVSASQKGLTRVYTNDDAPPWYRTCRAGEAASLRDAVNEF
jgi:hypothetical protein